MRWFAIGLALLSGCALAELSAPAARGEEATSLVSLVPADAGVCIELIDLYSHGRKLISNPLLARVREFPPLAEWVQENGFGLDEIISRLAQALGVTPDALGDKLFGRHVVLAAWPPESPRQESPSGVDVSPSSAVPSPAADPAEDGTPSWEDGQGLALLRATDPALVEKLIAVLSGLEVRGQQAAGPREVQYAGAKYLVRELPRGDKTIRVYLATLGPIGVLTNSERAMQGVLDLHAKQRQDSLAGLALYQAAQAHVATDAAIRVFVNPRIWDKLMLTQLREEIEIDEIEIMGDGLSQVWQASQYWVASIDLDYGFRLDSHMQFDPARVSTDLSAALASLQGQTNAFDHVRHDAALAVAMRVDLGKLASVFIPSDDESLAQYDDMRDMARSMFMGMDIIDDILPELGPDVRLSLHETFDERDRPVPGWVIGVKTKPRAEGDDRPEVAEVLQTGVSTALQVASTFMNNRFGGQGRKSEVVEDIIDGVKVTSLEGVRFLPAGLVPTYAIQDGYFVLGSSRQAVVDAVQVKPENSLGRQDHLRKILGERFAAPGQLAYIDCPRLRKIIKEQPQLIRFTLGAARGLSTRQVTESLRTLDQVLALAETIVMASKFENDSLSATLIMSMDPVQPAAVARRK